eukprot:symbB.v1.2.007983.t1/scaffold496.1/size195705/7
MNRSVSCPAKEKDAPLLSVRGLGGDGLSPSSPLSPLLAASGSAGSPTWASRKYRALREARRPQSRLDTARLEPLTLAKGAVRHHRPMSSSRKLEQQETSQRPPEVAIDFDAAEALGRKILGKGSWVKRIFEEFDGSACGFLWPAEFAALKARFEQAMGSFGSRCNFSFDVADSNMEGRISTYEWENYASILIAELGDTRCRVAAERVLGSRKAEQRRKVKHVYIAESFEAQASVRLLEVCSKGHKNHSLLEDIRVALSTKADPNAGLASPAFNDYTPLIFLASTPPSANGHQVAQAMELLITSRADVHRECGQMHTGRLVPLRFAARAQNEYGLETLQRHMDLGDAFQWAAGESAVGIMLSELRRVYGQITDKIEAMASFSHVASTQLRLFASPIFPGGLSPACATSMCKGSYYDGHVKRGQKADPNSPGLEGMTALMHMINEGNIPVIEALLDCRATLDQRDSSGATPLHFAAMNAKVDVVKLLLDRGAEPSSVNHAGFSPWMVVAEVDADPSPRADDIRECLELLKPKMLPEELLQAEMPEDLLQMIRGDVTMESLEKTLRLHESLFFNPRMAIHGSFEGRTTLNSLLERWANMLIQMLQLDPLKGDMKTLAKYLLNATKGPESGTSFAGIRKIWQQDDNRSSYRPRLTEAVKKQLQLFAEDCKSLRAEVDRAAAKAQEAEAAEAAEAAVEEVESEAVTKTRGLAEVMYSYEEEHARAAYVACQKLLDIPKDTVTIPEAWQVDPYWKKVQERQVLRYDPEWSLKIKDGASCFLQMLRLGVPLDPSAKLKGQQAQQACVVSSIPEYSQLRQVLHAQMKELYARGYVTYSNLCNKAFQDKMKEIVARARDDSNLTVEMPNEPVLAKRLQRILEKTIEAEQERAGWGWPDRSEQYLHHTYCFYILDTVRMSFGCKGETVPEQVHCCMRVLQEFQGCSVEVDGVQLLRTKSGFAAGVAGDGGYADVKLLLYADLGKHVAFDGTEIPLRIIGEVQLILDGYEAVKKRMHLVYEVNRGSFDRKLRR